MKNLRRFILAAAFFALFLVHPLFGDNNPTEGL